MRESEFQIEMRKIVAPKLRSLGFSEVTLKDCIGYEILFNKDRLWFGASWDYRDQYLEVELGHLYWFKDVMPRVIILGSYDAYGSKLKSLSVETDQYLTRVAELVRDSIEGALAIYEQRYNEILAARKNPQSLKYPPEFVMHLGDEVSKADLRRFTI